MQDDENLIEVNPFDAWYLELCTVLKRSNKRAPYKMEWLEFYDAGMSPKDAANVGPSDPIE